MKDTFKKHLLILLLTLSTTVVLCQVPQRMSYQSVIRNSSGNLVANSLVSQKISILKNSATGMVVYSETTTKTTNENGLLTIEIGGGNPTTGTFESINWASGNYFIKTETDPTGGSNYTIVGVSQLLSVPYALFSGKSPNLGKTTITLTDDITNSEAAAIIASEAGVNTEKIIISNTTQLTTVDLSAVKTLISLEVIENQNLTTLNLVNLTSIFEEANIDGNTQLSSINLNSLSKNPKKMVIGTNGVATLSFPSMVKLSKLSQFIISSNPNLTTINFQALNSAGFNSILLIEKNNTLNSFLTPVLNNAFGIALIDNINLQTFNFGALTQVNQLILTRNKFSSISIPNLTQGGISVEDTNTTLINIPLISTANTISISKANINSLSFPLLTSCVVLNFTENPNLASVSLPQLATISELVQIKSNALLNTINLSSLSTINPQNNNYSFFFDLSFNAFPTNRINSILNKLTTINQAIGRTINLSNQNPLAPPTGQGIIDKQTLINSGFIVLTD
jgi:hypothetical protein